MTTGQDVGNELSENLRPLFVGGCQRSGTTAFADYLNVHPGIVVCQERYKRIPRERVNPAFFTFGRILDYRKGETNKPWNLDYYVRRHREILEKKDPARLRWIGDKNPGLVKAMDVLTENNPGARFIVLYRPVEEVAESWEARAKNPQDHWKDRNDFEAAVEEWNRSLRRLHEFVERSPTPRVLVIGYHDFFGDNERCVPLISRFLGLEIDDYVAGEWRRMSEEFVRDRRPKKPLSDEQLSYIGRHADREAEGWVLDRIGRQWEEPGLYVEQDLEPALAARDAAEARAWRSEQRLRQLEEELAGERRRAAEAHRRARAWKEQFRDARERLRELRGSTTFRTLAGINRIRRRVLGG